jgi:hypothetical protein
MQSPDALLETLIEIKIQLAKISSNQEHFLNRFEEHLKDDKELAMRVSGIEAKLHWAAGAIALFVGFFSLVTNFVMRKLG